MLEREKETRRIVFFDGVCHLCNFFIDFVVRNETIAKSFFFAPLQGQTAQRFLSEADRKELKSVVYWDGKSLHRQSEAVLLVGRHLRFPYSYLARVAELIPSRMRNRLYDWVALHRYSWFGQLDSCRLPTAAEKAQLLE